MDRNTENLSREKERLLMEIQFIHFISDLTNSALQFMGRIKNPKTNEFSRNIKNAEKMMYVLGMLTEKTKNNLTDMEKDHLRNSLDRLKQTYYEETQLTIAREQISIRHILVDSESEATELLSKIRSGSDFSELAKMHSQCSSRVDGGFIEGIKHGDFPRNIEDTAFKLGKDETSPVMHSRLGYHIVKLIDKYMAEENND